MSGRLSCGVSPVVHVAVPTAFRAMLLMTHVLTAALFWFGIGRGGPKRQPALVQVRASTPVSVSVVAASTSFVPLQHVLVNDVPRSGTWFGSATPTNPPPKYRPPDVSGPRHVPPSMHSASVVQSLPQLDGSTHCTHFDGISEPVWRLLGADVVNLSCVGSGVPQAQALAVSHWHDSLQI